MRLLFIALLCVAALSACPSTSNPDGSTGGGRGGGAGGGGGLSQFAVMDLDPTAGIGPAIDGGADAGYQGETPYFAIAVDPTQERVGVAYYTPAGTFTVGPGTPDYNLNYLEYNNVTGVVTPPVTIRFMQRKIGLSLQFNPTTGEPIVAYLGGSKGFVVGESISWFQSDAVFNQRVGGVWGTETTVAKNSNDVICGNGPSDIGFLVGVWPSIVFDAQNKLVYGYRDCHDGQFPQQDWGASDVEIWDGPETSLTGHCVEPGGNNKGAWGGHLLLVEGKTQPAVVYDRMLGTADTNGSDVVFQQRKADGSWTPAVTLLNIANTQTGATMAFDKDTTADAGTTEGLGIAVVDRATNVLYYTNSLDGVAWSRPADEVYGSGSGGWYPSVAMDPVYHEPAIAYYVCSDKSGINDTSCSTTEDSLWVTQRINGNWNHVLVDSGGGYAPKLAFFASGKRVIVYRVPPAIDPDTALTVTNVGALKIAVER